VRCIFSMVLWCLIAVSASGETKHIPYIDSGDGVGGGPQHAGRVFQGREDAAASVAHVREPR
jgi:predicted NBD/HSP70 family sugar kinase